MCFLGKPFKGHGEMETEVTNHLISELKSQTTDGSATRICYVNLAAQYTAAVQFQSRWKSTDAQWTLLTGTDSSHILEYMQSYFMYLRLNISTFTVLLDLLSINVADTDSNAMPRTQPQTVEELFQHINATTLRLLPLLRLYSAWLLTNEDVLKAGVGDDNLKSIIYTFWKKYASTVSDLAAKFPVKHLSEIPYQLEEDVDAIGFKPLSSARTETRWTEPETQSSRPKFSDSSVQRQSKEQEALSRIRGLLIDALLLAAGKVCNMFICSLTLPTSNAAQGSFYWF